MSDNTEVTKCPFLNESKCPMGKCTYMTNIKIEDAKDCPYLKKSKCPKFNDDTNESSLCKNGVCPFKKN